MYSIRHRSRLLSSLAVGLLFLSLQGCAGPAANTPATRLDDNDPAQGANEDALASALEVLHTSLRRAENAIRAYPAFEDETQQAGAYRFLASSLIQSLEAELLQDPDFPYFRFIDFWLPGGGDNPDQRYAFSRIRGGEAYRIRGELGSARRVEIQLYAGQPWGDTGRSAGYLAFEELALEQDGSFVVELSAEPPANLPANGSDEPLNWIANPYDATTVFVRHIYDEWNLEPTGGVHIDRVGFEGRRRPPRTGAEAADGLRAAATNFEMRVKTWPAFVEQRYVKSGPANTLSDLYDTYAVGGARGRWMAGGHFDIAPGKAVLVRMSPTAAVYQAIQLANPWFDSLEHANQISSLNSTQVITAPDGAIYHVISAEDPGYANWLDTGGIPRGVILLRYDGVRDTIPESKRPTAKLVDLTELPQLIPGYARVDEAEREAVRSGRRKHLQIRSHR